jgi:hypothetical protein
MARKNTVIEPAGLRSRAHAVGEGLKPAASNRRVVLLIWQARQPAAAGLTGGLLRVVAGPFGVSTIGREVVPQHQPRRDVERDKAHRADDPPIQPIHERPPSCAIVLPTREVPKCLISLVSAEGLEPSTP